MLPIFRIIALGFLRSKVPERALQLHEAVGAVVVGAAIGASVTVGTDETVGAKVGGMPPPPHTQHISLDEKSSSS